MKKFAMMFAAAAALFAAVPAASAQDRTVRVEGTMHREGGMHRSGSMHRHSMNRVVRHRMHRERHIDRHVRVRHHHGM